MPLARIVGFHGLRGLLKLELLSDYVERLEKGQTVYMDGAPIVVADSTVHSGRILIKLTGYTDRNGVEQLRGKLLEAEDLPVDPEKGTFRVSDLIGCEVVTPEGKHLGPVANIEAMPAQDVLVVGELMVPFAKEFIKKIDLKAKMITVQLIPGMLPEEDE